MIFKPEDFGLVGQGNDTAALQGAIDAVRQDGKGVVEIRNTLNFGAINAAYCSNLQIECEIGAVHTCGALAGPAALIDLCHSHNVVISNLVITLPSPGISEVVYPKAALLLHGSDKTTLNNITVNGTASAGALCIVGASSISVRDSQFINYDPHAPTVMLSNLPDWGITSLFNLGPVEAVNMPDVYFSKTEVHALGGAPWTVYMRNADHIQFDGGLSANFKRAHVLFQGYCHAINDIGRKFYKGDIGSNPHPLMVFEAGAGTAVVGHVAINPSYTGIPALRGGAGSFQYAATIP